MAKDEEGSKPYMESPVLPLVNNEENNNMTVTKKFLNKLNSSTKRKADIMSLPTVAKKIKTTDDLASDFHSTSSTETLLPPTDRCRRRSWRRNSANTLDFY